MLKGRTFDKAFSFKDIEIEYESLDPIPGECFTEFSKTILDIFGVILRERTSNTLRHQYLGDGLVVVDTVEDYPEKILDRESIASTFHEIAHILEAIDPENKKLHDAYFPDIYCTDFDFPSNTDGLYLEDQVILEARATGYYELLLRQYYTPILGEEEAYKLGLEAALLDIANIQSRADDVADTRVCVFAEFIHFTRTSKAYNESGYLNKLISNMKETLEGIDDRGSSWADL